MYKYISMVKLFNLIVQLYYLSEFCLLFFLFFRFDFSLSLFPSFSCIFITIRCEEFCAFCKNNGKSVYKSYKLKDNQNRVCCPRLRGYKCNICGAFGYNAHTPFDTVHIMRHFSSRRTLNRCITND